MSHLTCPALQLAPFVQDLDSVNAGVILDRDERKHQFALSVRLKGVKHFMEWPVFAAGFLENIEIAQQRGAVHVDIENTGACAAARRFLGPEPGFAKKQS